MSTTAFSTPSVGVFFSPPEAIKPDTFASPTTPRFAMDKAKHLAAGTTSLPSFRSLFASCNDSPLSPPISPAVQIDQEPGTTNSRPVSRGGKDYELFPNPPEPSSPLFKPSESHISAEHDAISRHIQARQKQGLTGPTPTRQEYNLAVTFKSRVIERYNADPVRWYMQEREFMKAYPPRFPQNNAPVAASKRKADNGERTTNRQRVSKPVGAKTALPKRVRPSPREAPLDDLTAQPVIKHRRKVSRTTPTPREDMDYRLVPDYCPPVSLMAPGKNLKIEWKGHPLDLSTDPDRHMLDDAEVPLAATLRLTGAQYLFAKRKIFERYVELAQMGKELNKTSAQNVCKIDVNKASKLWIAFEKVGWFDRRHFSQYL